MKYYDDNQSAEIRTAFEKEVLSWAKVAKRAMFDCPAYLADGRLFAFLVTNGVVITQIRLRDKKAVSDIYDTSPFKIGEREIERWLQVTIEQPEKLKRLMRYVKKSYQFALGEDVIDL